MKRVMMFSGVAALALGALAMGLMLSGEKAIAESSTVARDGYQEPTLADLLRGQIGMSEEEAQAEDEYLRLDLGPDVDVSEIERVPSAADNQPYRTCEKTPEMQANLRSPGKAGHRAYRDIAGYLSVVNVIATRDCTCKAKIAPHDAIAAFEGKLREQFGVEVLRAPHTADLFDEYERQKKIVAAMCGQY